MAAVLDIFFSTQDLPELNALHDLMLEFCYDKNSFDAKIQRLPTVFAAPDGNKSLWINGFFTFQSLLQTLIYHPKCKNGISTNILHKLLKNSIEHSLITETVPGMFVSNQLNKEMIQFYHGKQILRNALINRPEYVVETYRDAILAIDVEKDGESYTGTGFICRFSEELYIVTAKHNIDKNDNITINSITSDTKQEIEFQKLDWHHSPDLDLSVARYEQTSARYFALSILSQVLMETITLGFPNIATTSERYMIAHRGEINAKVKSYLRKGTYLLISNAISPGNSGSPVVDRTGLVLGVATEAFEGKFEAYDHAAQAAIDVSDLQSFLEVVAARSDGPPPAVSDQEAL